LITLKIKEFPKDYKYLIGEKLFKSSFTIVRLVTKAYGYKEKREERLRIVISILNTVDLLARLSSDHKLFSLDTQVKVVELTDSISEQAKKWLVSIAKAE